jgi:hypothetical protein
LSVAHIVHHGRLVPFAWLASGIRPDGRQSNKDIKMSLYLLGVWPGKGGSTDDLSGTSDRYRPANDFGKMQVSPFAR